MTKREKLTAKITAKEKQITLIHKEIVELRKQALLLSDKVQWFTEEKETHGRGKNKQEMLIGRIHWKEDFKDEDTGKVITIERSMAVRVDGEWQ